MCYGPLLCGTCKLKYDFLSGFEEMEWVELPTLFMVSTFTFLKQMTATFRVNGPQDHSSFIEALGA